MREREDAKVWIIRNQLGRRNLTPNQASYLRGVEYRLTKKAQGGRADRDLSGDQNDHPKTADVLAKKHGVSAPTIKRDAEFAAAVDEVGEREPGLREKVMKGEGPLCNSPEYPIKKPPLARGPVGGEQGMLKAQKIDDSWVIWDDDMEAARNEGLRNPPPMDDDPL